MGYVNARPNWPRAWIEMGDKTGGGSSVAKRLPAVPQSEPSERERARWRSASHMRRQREKAGQRIYGLTQNEELVTCALMALHPDRTDLGDHNVRERLLAAYLETCLLGVIDDDSNLELRMNFAKLLRDQTEIHKADE